MDSEENIHQRVLKLKDVALGSTRNLTVTSALATASYDCTVDSLLALYNECSQSSLAKDKHVARFLSKYDSAVKALTGLRLTAADFEVQTVIGRGHFGEVQVVHEKSTGDVYAMKVMRKSHILQQADAAFFSEERDIMAWTTSPWLTSLHYAFQDTHNLYLVMDFHPGGDLLTVMERHEGGMNEEEARFYLSEIAAGLHDLHKLGFVHRDVKPENVLITRSGHIKLVDFGSAARLSSNGKVMEPRLPVGTPEYIAPEVLTSLDQTADYGVCCDWWSLGIIAYELVCDVTPFEGDSTAQTYGNIMNYKKSLHFPEDVEVSNELRDLIGRLLTDPGVRIEYKELKEHSFFSPTNWNDLLDTIPPYIPTINGTDDTSNFDVFEPKKEERYPDLPSHTRRSFTGKSLPFVGFTFTRFDSSHAELTDGELAATSSSENGSLSSSELKRIVKDLRKALEGIQREMQEAKETKASLERECVIYQSQLEDFHRKLEIEKSERRNSDSKALQLLSEVREQGRIAQELRENEDKMTTEELSVVVTQLEQDRMVASKRCKRLQEDLKKTQQERDTAVKKASDLKTKLSTMKDGNRKDITGLQAKLAKVTKGSLAKSAEMQDQLTEVHGKYAKASQRLKEVEGRNKKLEFDLQQIQVVRDEAKRSAAESRDQLKVLSEENASMVTQQEQLKKLLKDLEGQLDEAGVKNQRLEASEVKLKKELQDVRLDLDQMRQGRTQLRSSNDKMREELQSKTQLIQRKDEVMQSITRLNSTHQFLTAKLADLERLREAAEDNSIDESYRAQEERVSEVERERQQLSVEVSSLRSQLAAREEEVQRTREQMEEMERQNKESGVRLREEVKALQSKLSEVTETAIQQGERLRDVRRTKRELDQENSTLTGNLSKAEGQVKSLEEKVQKSSEELKSLDGVKKRLASLEGDMKTLEKLNNVMRGEIDSAKAEKEEVLSSKRTIETDLRHAKEQIETQELNISLLQKDVKSLEEELGEARAAAEEARNKETEWKAIKGTLKEDLETAESRLDDAYATVEKEKNSRAAAEKHLSEAMASLEKTAAAHSDEFQGLQEQLVTQKQLSSKYSDKVSELEKEVKLKDLELKEVEKGLDTEKALSSKLYDDLHNLGREHGKVKAAHMKLLNEAQQRESQLVQASAAKEKVLEERRSAEEAHRLQELRLQATVAQQSKLINYLQDGSPGKSRLKLKKGFKLSRKSRDPAKEMAEWSKIKGLVGKPKGAAGIVAHSSTPTVMLQRMTRSASQQSALLEPPNSAPQRMVTFDSPQSSGSSLDLPPVTQYFSVTSLEEEEEEPVSTSSYMSQLGVKECSVHIQRQNIPLSPKMGTPLTIAGKKRHSEDAPAGAQKTATWTGEMTIEHNIPHSFFLKSAPLHKKYTCVSCKSSIKHMQKLAKCSHCGIACHPTCIDSVPNDCGLPPQLADYAFSQQPSAKKPRKEGGREMTDSEDVETTEPSSKAKRGWKHGKKAQSEVESHPLTSSRRELERKTRSQVKGVRREEAGREAADQGQQLVGKRVAPQMATRERQDIIRIEKIFMPKGEIKCEGWLVLTRNTLCFYDRDPTRLARNPLNSFIFDSPESAFVLLAYVESHLLPYTSPSKQLPLAFGITQHSTSSEETTIFVANTIQSKIEWVEAIQSIISQCSQRSQSTPQVSKPHVRELKAVSVVPIKTLRSSLNKSGNSDILDISITSSMLESPSTSSVI